MQKSRPVDWGLEDSKWETLKTFTRAHVSTERDSKSCESHERIDCTAFPTVVVHFSDDRHYRNEGDTIELLIKNNLAFDSSNVVLFGTYKKATDADNTKNQRRITITKIQYKTGVVVDATFEAPAHKHNDKATD
jgi:hypothetical protein